MSSGSASKTMAIMIRTTIGCEEEATMHSQKPSPSSTAMLCVMIVLSVFDLFKMKASAVTVNASVMNR